MSTQQSRLDDRYGVSNSASQRTRRTVALTLLATAFVATVLWVSWVFINGNSVKAETLRYEHLGPSEIAVDFSLNMDPGTAVSCGVEALNSNRGQVGYTVVDIAPQTDRVTNHRAVITTQQEAVSGAVKDCERTN